MGAITTTIFDLNSLDLPVLLDMLSEQTFNYIKLIKEEGYSAKSNEARKAVISIQLAIENKKANKETILIPFDSFINKGSQSSVPA